MCGLIPMTVEESRTARFSFHPPPMPAPGKKFLRHRSAGARAATRTRFSGSGASDRRDVDRRGAPDAARCFPVAARAVPRACGGRGGGQPHVVRVVGDGGRRGAHPAGHPRAARGVRAPRSARHVRARPRPAGLRRLHGRQRPPNRRPALGGAVRPRGVRGLRPVGRRIRTRRERRVPGRRVAAARRPRGRRARGALRQPAPPRAGALLGRDRRSPKGRKTRQPQAGGSRRPAIAAHRREPRARADPLVVRRLLHKPDGAPRRRTCDRKDPRRHVQAHAHPRRAGAALGRPHGRRLPDRRPLARQLLVPRGHGVDARRRRRRAHVLRPRPRVPLGPAAAPRDDPGRHPAPRRAARWGADPRRRRRLASAPLPGLPRLPGPSGRPRRRRGARRVGRPPELLGLPGRRPSLHWLRRAACPVPGRAVCRLAPRRGRPVDDRPAGRRGRAHAGRPPRAGPAPAAAGPRAPCPARRRSHPPPQAPLGRPRADRGIAPPRALVRIGRRRPGRHARSAGRPPRRRGADRDGGADAHPAAVHDAREPRAVRGPRGARSARGHARRVRIDRRRHGGRRGCGGERPRLGRFLGKQPRGSPHGPQGGRGRAAPAVDLLPLLLRSLPLRRRPLLPPPRPLPAHPFGRPRRQPLPLHDRLRLGHPRRMAAPPRPPAARLAPHRTDPLRAGRRRRAARRAARRRRRLRVLPRRIGDAAVQIRGIAAPLAAGARGPGAPRPRRGGGAAVRPEAAGVLRARRGRGRGALGGGVLRVPGGGRGGGGGSDRGVGGAGAGGEAEEDGEVRGGGGGGCGSGCGVAAGGWGGGGGAAGGAAGEAGDAEGGHPDVAGEGVNRAGRWDRAIGWSRREGPRKRNRIRVAR
ncbi:hypothetical protein DFJ74DRAFT_745874, partial [Hyaloraphidium curvatum]